MADFKTKDSGTRYQEQSGFQRDTQEGKPMFYLLFPKGIPYHEQFIVRWAKLMERGARKYAQRNWEIADSESALERAKESLMRHATQAICDETDEDHLSAVAFNAMFIATLQYKLAQKKEAAKNE